MVTPEEFTLKLKESMEKHSRLLQSGDLMLPPALKKKVFVNGFAPVVKSLAKKSGVKCRPEHTNKFLDGADSETRNEYDLGKFQRVDFILFEKEKTPLIFLELESLGRSQLCLFSDGGVSSNRNDIDNKLWYYYGTLANHYTMNQKVPRYFIFLLILPEKQVEPYMLWDLRKPYELYHPSLQSVIYQCPYQFFDRQIKTLARAFLKREDEFKIDGKWTRKSLNESQAVCELVFITCTIDRLILSRGKDLFDPHNEEKQSFEIKWRSIAGG